MRIYLTIPKKDLTIAKRRGVKFDYNCKMYYIIDPLHFKLFKMWRPQILTEKGLRDLESVHVLSNTML